MTLAFCQGKLPAYLDCEFNMVDVRDIAGGMRAAMRSGQPGMRYLLSGRNLQLIEWLSIVGSLIGRPAPRWQVPYPVALGVAHVNEWLANQFTGKIPLATVTGVKLTRYSMHFEAEKSRRDLGLCVRPVEESARDAVAWFRQKDWL